MPTSNDVIEKVAVEDGLALNWSLKNKNIYVKTLDQKVILSGIVDSVYQKEEARRIAWAALDIWSLENDLVVENEYY